MSSIKNEADNQKPRSEEPFSPSTRSQESIQFKFQLPQNSSNNRENNDFKISNIQQVFGQQKNDSKRLVQTTEEKKNVNIFILPDQDFQMTLRFIKEDSHNDKSQKCPVCKSNISVSKSKESENIADETKEATGNSGTSILSFHSNISFCENDIDNVDKCDNDDRPESKQQSSNEKMNENEITHSQKNSSSKSLSSNESISDSHSKDSKSKS